MQIENKNMLKFDFNISFLVIFVLCVILGVLFCLDVISTSFIIWFGGLEYNPVMIIFAYNPVLHLIFKIAIAYLIIKMAMSYEKKYQYTGVVALGMVNIWYIFVICNNLGNLMIIEYLF
ncbi:hypothetical protein J2128_001938 [Methanomicrobium sp. W14]|uniref:DUF5658 family protein n=1 Tax=Methanomicrobium sp. W14 TaxID=2817839 RepID=UPI001AEA5650|nr:DUF5658 family protein [Methanomicrobium sp. W14]MBP2133972.1 hypothetical protein [Methanomicrobium sp. W14]